MADQTSKVFWRTAYLGCEWPLYASLEPMGQIFATVSRVEVPVPGWDAVIRHHGWERRLVAHYPTIEMAQKGVERWSDAHRDAVREAPLLDQDRQNRRC